jgi:phenylalanyl-tRNA synthetase beta subunit
MVRRRTLTGRSLSNEEVNALQDKVQAKIVSEMGIEMR